MTASANEGLIRQRFERIRGEDPTSALAIGYQDGGMPRGVQGDENGPFVIVPPFPTGPAQWFEHTFLDTEYLLLPTLAVENVRTVTTFFRLRGVAAGSTFSVIPGSVLPGAASPPLDSDFYMFAAVNPTLTELTLNPPFNNPASSRAVMPAEFRTLSFGATKPLHFAMQWDVSSYAFFTLALADLETTEGVGASVLVHYAFAT